jgi:hypothetical protein
MTKERAGGGGGPSPAEAVHNHRSAHHEAGGVQGETETGEKGYDWWAAATITIVNSLSVSFPSSLSDYL